MSNPSVVRLGFPPLSSSKPRVPRRKILMVPCFWTRKLTCAVYDQSRVSGDAEPPPHIVTIPCGRQNTPFSFTAREVTPTPSAELCLAWRGNDMLYLFYLDNRLRSLFLSTNSRLRINPPTPDHPTKLRSVTLSLPDF